MSEERGTNVGKMWLDVGGVARCRERGLDVAKRGLDIDREGAKYWESGGLDVGERGLYVK